MGQFRRIIAAEAEELRKVAESFDESALNRLYHEMEERAGSVFITGCGTSAAAAKKAVHTLQVVERKAFFLDPTDAVHGGLGAIDDNDVVVFISKGGVSYELIAFLPNVKSKGAFVASVGENPTSSIAQASDLFIRVGIDREPDCFNMLATASTLATIAVFDALAIVHMTERGYSQAEFLLNHPGGDVGRRLFASES